MPNKEQYLKYKDQFKQQSILGIISGACMFIGILLFLFLSLFEIKLGDAVLYNFSLYDVIRESIDGVFAGRLGMFSIWQVFAVVYIVVGSIWYLVGFVRKTIGLVNLETYSLEQYDEIKSHNSSRDKRWRGNWTADQMLISGFALECLVIIFARWLYDSVEISSDVLGDLDHVGYKLALCNGVSSLVILPLIFLVAGVVCMALKSISARKTKMAILKEDYGVSDEKVKIDSDD